MSFSFIKTNSKPRSHTKTRQLNHPGPYIQYVFPIHQPIIHPHDTQRKPSTIHTVSLTCHSIPISKLSFSPFLTFRLLYCFWRASIDLAFHSSTLLQSICTITLPSSSQTTTQTTSFKNTFILHTNPPYPHPHPPPPYRVSSHFHSYKEASVVTVPDQADRMTVIPSLMHCRDTAASLSGYCSI